MCCICLGRLWVSKLFEQMRRKGGACWRSRTGFGLPKRRYKFRISEKAIKSESNSDDKLKNQKEKELHVGDPGPTLDFQKGDTNLG